MHVIQLTIKDALWPNWYRIYQLLSLRSPSCNFHRNWNFNTTSDSSNLIGGIDYRIRQVRFIISEISRLSLDLTRFPRVTANEICQSSYCNFIKETKLYFHIFYQYFFRVVFRILPFYNLLASVLCTLRTFLHFYYTHKWISIWSLVTICQRKWVLRSSV